MLVVMQPNATAADIDRVCEEIVRQGFKPLPLPGEVRTAIGLLGDDAKVDWSYIEGLPGVASVLIVQKPFRQASREWKNETTVVEIAPGVRIGGSDVPVIAGPCSVESEAQILTAARQVRAAGGVALRGGAFKPRSSPYAFQGLGKQGLELLALARRETGLA
ncbi:MAG: 3-deoxy-7-phosphoheptulonate synthase, partial [Gemmatimonas sp.]